MEVMEGKGGDEAIVRVDRVVAMAARMVRGEEVMLRRPPRRFCDGHDSVWLWVVEFGLRGRVRDD